MHSLRLSRTTLFAAIAGLGAATACTTDSSIADENEVASAIELDNGGFDTADEAPLFGAPDHYELANLEADATFGDEMEADTAMADMRDIAGAVSHRVLVAWGQLPPDRNQPNAKVWTGALQLTRGGMIVRRVVGFENATDHVIRPRTDRNTVAFESVTRPFADGLVLEVVDPTPGDGNGLVLSYHGAAGDHDLDLAQLASGPIVIDIDADGNKLIAISLRRLANAADPCNRGFMRGRWHRIRPGLGAFIGVVADADGSPIGHVRGIYGQRRNGERVLFGKFIDRDGRFDGIMAGHYRDGEFTARWLTRTGDAGRVHGAFRESLPGEEVGGGWVARWAETTCAQDLPPDGP
jgi:hypothetical protein